jgi:hypothetical protein
MTTRKLDTFIKRFAPIEGPTAHNDGWWTIEEVTGLDRSLTYVWTEVDPGGNVTYLPGLHYVNRTGNYTVTEVPWTEADCADEYRVSYSLSGHFHP